MLGYHVISNILSYFDDFFEKPSITLIEHQIIQYTTLSNIKSNDLLHGKK